MMLNSIALLCCGIWLYLLVGRGQFWRGAERDDDDVAPPATWPAIAAIVPARNEADYIAASIGSLLRQDYAGAFTIILVDDGSQDGTAAIASALATGGTPHALTVVTGQALPSRWTGKLWAVKQGVDATDRIDTGLKYLLLTDADIVHAADSIRRLVGRAEAGGLVLTSLMAKLRCQSLAERALIPAFIFFFQMLYPFGWVNRPDHAIAAAAGGCMLVRADALEQAGGVEAVRGALIDDCALAQRLKLRGPIWLGLTERVRSIRRYPHIDDIRRMVSRSAYAQLRYSPLMLAGTVAGLALTYLVAPLLAIFGSGLAQGIAIATWGLMAVAFAPTLRFYSVSPLWGLALPAIACLYMLFTLDSAYQYARGRGGAWKGRAQANLSDPS